MFLNLRLGAKAYLLIFPAIVYGVVLLLVVPASLKAMWDRERPSDFVGYLIGARIYRDGKINNLYEYNTQKTYQEKHFNAYNQGLLAFRTPPTTAAIYSYLPIEKPEKAIFITLFINLVCVFGTVLLLSKNFTQAIIFGVLSAAFPSIWMTLYNGHPNGPLILLLTLTYLALKRGFGWLAGFLTAFMFLKPNYLLAAPLIFSILPNKQTLRAFSLSFFITFCFLIATNSVIFGPNFAKSYGTFLFASENIEHGTDLARNSNIGGVLFAVSRFFGFNYNAVGSFILSITLLLVVMAILHKNRGGAIEWNFAAAMMFTPILNIHTMHSDLIPTLIAFMLLLPHLVENRRFLASLFLLTVSVIATWLFTKDWEWISSLFLLGFSFWLILNPDVDKKRDLLNTQ